MTDKLQTLMREQADSVDFAVPDLDAMVATGDRRVRNRRLGATVGTVAAAVALVAAATTLPSSPTDRVSPAAPTSGHPTVSWVLGSDLHEADLSSALDFRPLAYVRTSGGYVFSDREGAVWSWVDGKATEVGRTDPRQPRLVVDEGTARAGWYDDADGSFVVLDQQQGTFDRHYPTRREDGVTELVALDGGTWYWKGPRGSRAFDTDTGRETTIALAAGERLLDVQDGALVIAGNGDLAVGQPDDRVVWNDVHGEYARLSGDGRWLMLEGDRARVLDTVTGDRVALDLDRGFATGYEWLDNDTLAVLAAVDDAAPAELWTCEVPAGGCDAVTELDTFEQLGDTFLLPVGEPMG